MTAHYSKWAIEITGSPLDGHRTFLKGDFETGMTMLFSTRARARKWLAEYKRRSVWAFTGGYACQGRGNRIYKSARVVEVKVTIERRAAA